MSFDVTDLPLLENPPALPDGIEARLFADWNGPGEHAVVLWDAFSRNHVAFPQKDADRSLGPALHTLMAAPRQKFAGRRAP